LSRLSDTAPSVSGALVSGSRSRVLFRISDSPHVANLVYNLRPELRAELGAAVGAIRRTTAEFDRAEQRSFRSPEATRGGGERCSRVAGLVAAPVRRATAFAAGLCYVVLKKPTLMVWFPLSSRANTSSSYTVSGSRNSAGTLREFTLAGTCTS